MISIKPRLRDEVHTVMRLNARVVCCKLWT